MLKSATALIRHLVSGIATRVMVRKAAAVQRRASWAFRAGGWAAARAGGQVRVDVFGIYPESIFACSAGPPGPSGRRAEGRAGRWVFAVFTQHLQDLPISLEFTKRLQN